MKNNETAYYPDGEDIRYQTLTHENERTLFAAARAGDEAAREFLIRNHLLYAAIQGRRWAKGLPEDEVISAANYALMIAFEKFDYTRENRFSSYLRPFIRAQIALLWRSRNTVGEHQPVFLEEKIPTLRHIMGTELGEDLRTNPEVDDHDKFLLGLLEKSKGILTDREAEIIRRHYGEDRECMSKIAEDFKMTRERIRQIKDDALAKLRRELGRQMKSKGIER
jgi:RNA polymerase primary sigma factor